MRNTNHVMLVAPTSSTCMPYYYTSVILPLPASSSRSRNRISDLRLFLSLRAKHWTARHRTGKPDSLALFWTNTLLFVHCIPKNSKA
ncbi:hypothetical protein HD806DRAFT_495407 [Xylariaceae sp. AK1471]|nr:hypothetical protein HD806DRAFT_495407 [Xylariaceae sp. AK1471]